MLHFACTELIPEGIVTFSALPVETVHCESTPATAQSDAARPAAEDDATAGLPDHLIYAKIFASPFAAWICSTVGAIIGLACGALAGDSHGAMIGGAVGILFGKILCSIATDGRYS
ncbi:MAG: hypothetical protein JNL84_14545 [Candidatus Accumulibacter sp.]|nr:hypothetical protein [Accumulibacter sp.]